MTRFKPFHRSIFLSAIVVVFVYGNQIGQRQDLNCCRPFMLQVATTLPTLVFGSFLNSALSYLQCISAFWYIGNCYLSRVPGLPILVNLSTLESAYYFGDSLPVYFTFIFLEIHICRRSEIFLTQTLKLNDLLPTSFFIYTFFKKYCHLALPNITHLVLNSSQQLNRVGLYINIFILAIPSLFLFIFYLINKFSL